MMSNFIDLHSLKTKAFTMLELVIVMLISSILVVFLWLSYKFINERIESGKRSNEWIQNFLFFDLRMRDDISNADCIWLVKNEVELRSSIAPIKYILTDSCIIRHSFESDTLLFEHPSYAMKCLIRQSVDTMLVGQINVDFFSFNRDFSMWYIKDYDSKVLFNQGLNSTLDYEWIRF